MEREKFEKLGDELREIGHVRRQLAEKVFNEVQEKDNRSSKEVFSKLSNVSDQAISIITQQKQIFDQEVGNLQ